MQRCEGTCDNAHGIKYPFDPPIIFIFIIQPSLLFLGVIIHTSQTMSSLLSLSHTHTLLYAYYYLSDTVQHLIWTYLLPLSICSGLQPSGSGIINILSLQMQWFRVWWSYTHANTYTCTHTHWLCDPSDLSLQMREGKQSCGAIS